MTLVIAYHCLDFFAILTPSKRIGVIPDDLPQGRIGPGIRTMDDGYLIALVEHDVPSLGCDLPIAPRERPRQLAHLLETSIGMQVDHDVALRNL